MVNAKRMRADAQLNRRRLLEAATEMTLETGVDVPIDAIARRAQVGIGTLYRHFPDRNALFTGIALHAIDRAIEAAERAVADAGDAYAALRQYMHAAVERGVGVLNLVAPLIENPDWGTQRARIGTLLDTILSDAKAATLIRDDVEVADIVFPVIRHSRPVSMGQSKTDERALAHRHLDIYIDGLGSGASSRPSTQVSRKSGEQGP